MATAWSTLRTDIRNRLVESTADFYTNAELLTWANYGYRRFIERTEWCEKIKAYPMVANQFLYTLPTDIIKITMLRWQDKFPVKGKDLEEFTHYTGAASTSPGARPLVYQHFPWDTKIRLYPVPNASSASTTVDGAHNDSVTTIAVASASSFPSVGRVIIGTEQILYYAKSGNNLQQCVRGDGFTTAASYSGGETVTYAPLELYHTYLPPDLSGDSDTPRIATTYEEAIVLFTVATALQKKERFKDARDYFDAFEQMINKALAEREKMQRDRQFAIKDEDEFYWSP